MQTVKIGTLVKITKGKKVIFGVTGKNNFIDIGTLRDNTIKSYTDEIGVYANKNDIIIAWDGSKSGTVGYGLEGVIGSTLAKLQITDENIDTTYVGEFLKSNFKYFNSNVSGVAIPHLNKEMLVNLEIPLPPLPTQKLIVSEIEKQFSRLDYGLESLKKIKINLKGYKASVLKSAVEGKLTEEWRSEYIKSSDFESAEVLLEKILKAKKEQFLADNPGKKYKEAELIFIEELSSFKIPKSWVFCRLSQITEKSGNGFSKRNGDKGELTVVLRLADIKDGKISFDDIRKINMNIEEIKKFKLNKDDILFIRVNGSKDLCGKLIIFTDIDKVATYCDHFIRITLNNNICPDYIKYLFNSSLGRNFILDKMVSSAGQNTISQTSLNSFNIPLPPLAEQKKIVEEVESRLSVIEEIENLIDINIKKANNLKQSILKKAFSGELIKE